MPSASQSCKPCILQLTFLCLPLTMCVATELVSARTNQQDGVAQAAPQFCLVGNRAKDMQLARRILATSNPQMFMKTNSVY